MDASKAGRDRRSTGLAGGRVRARADRSTRPFARVEAAWAELQDSYTGLSDARMTEPGVAGDWSVKDVLAHVTTWEEEALRHLPTILAGGRPPRYAAVGGIDAFNARTAEQNRGLSLADVRMRLEETHARLVSFIRGASGEQIARDSRARRRLRLDTYGHYALHADAIRAWRLGRPDE